MPADERITVDSPAWLPVTYADAEACTRAGLRGIARRILDTLSPTHATPAEEIRAVAEELTAGRPDLVDGWRVRLLALAAELDASPDDGGVPDARET